MREILPKDVAMVQEKAWTIRKEIIKMLGKAGSGHTGGSLSSAEILACLYFWEMTVKPGDPGWEERDRFVLSKGHGAPVLYATLAEKGFFPKDWLDGLRKLGSPLQGHPDRRKLPGVEASTGSLGQGISWAVGMALAGKLDKKGYRVYTVLGDGELEEGMVWEAAMAAAHYHLDNLVAIIDFNGLQIDGRIQEVMSPLPIPDKFKAFGWETMEVNGHQPRELMDAFNMARNIQGKPVAIIAHTVKGKGCSFMENRVEWHGTAPKGEEIERALADINSAAGNNC